MIAKMKNNPMMGLAVPRKKKRYEKMKAKISKVVKTIIEFFKTMNSVRACDCVAVVLSVAFIVTSIKCIIVGGPTDSRSPTVTEAVATPDAEKEVIVEVEYVYKDLDLNNLPIVRDKEPVDLSEYNISLAAPIHEEYPGFITVYTDLESRMDISEKDIGRIIEWWTEEVPDTTLKDQSVATAFIYAAQQTNLDPIFLLALTGQESGWGTSKLHYETCNPYSIGMQDDRYLDLSFGDTYQESIINGAQWIRDNFYNSGFTTLYSMEYGSINMMYATDVNWMADISEIMDISYKIMLGEIE